MNSSSNPSMDCCREYEKASQLSRRRFLKGMAATSAAAVGTTMFGDALRQASFGATTGGNVLVVISLRGGIDGLGMVVPHGDPAYYTARPSIAVPRESLVAQDAMFGLHPKMKPLEWLYSSGELAAVHAVGMPVPNRSHFAAMEEIEDADPTSAERRGWVNRMIGLNSTVDPAEAIYLGPSTLPTPWSARLRPWVRRAWSSCSWWAPRSPPPGQPAGTTSSIRCGPATTGRLCTTATAPRCPPSTRCPR